MIRFAIWTAVSTEEQARSDKDSLLEQEKRCRAIGKARGWKMIGRPYVARGQSRTRYVNLRDAEDEIPALHRLLEDAKAHLFDLVVLYDYNRLRDILDLVAKALASYGVQIFSVNQPIEPLPPEEFSPYASDSESIMRGMSQIISRWQINDLRRKRAYGVFGRATKGLHPSGTKPFGYTYRGPKQPLMIEPAQAAICVQIKDLFLQGLSVNQIVLYLNERDVPAPKGKRWTFTGVRYILMNPFYAGQVRLGFEKKIVDPRTGKIKLTYNDPSKILLSDGQHQPLWDRATHQHILDELKRRSKRYKGRATQRLSSLLYCAEHDRPLHYRPVNGIFDSETVRWACRAVPGWWHVCILDKDVLAQLTEQLRATARKMEKKVKLPARADDVALLRSARDDLVARRERLTDALEQGALDPAVYGRRTKSLDAEIWSLQEKLSAIESLVSARSQKLDAMQRLLHAIESTPGFLIQAPAQLVNAQLRDVLEKITVDEEGNLELWPR